MEGKPTPFLVEFLETYIPEGKKSKIKIGVQDTKLAKALSTELGYQCTNSDVVLELFRGVKTHIDSYIKGKIESQTFSLTQACIGMGHSISRNLIEFDVNR